jgi:hypothetical protein
MISGADDRIAFVIQTEAQLDGIRAARGEIKGLATDAQASSQRMAAASKAQASQLSTDINMNIGAFIKRGEVIDKTSAEALAAYRAEGDALSANLARLGATEQELNKIGAAISRIEQQGGAATAFGPMLGPALPPGGIIPAAEEEKVKRFPGHLRTAANAMAMLSNAAITGQGSTQGLMVAAGGLATGLASLSKTAAIATAATGIGAIVTVGALVVTALQHMGSAAKATQAQLDNLKNFTAANIQANLAGIRAARDQAMADAVKAADMGFWARLKRTTSADLTTKEGRTIAVGLGVDFTKMDRLNELNEAASKIELERAHTERMRLLALHDQTEFQIKSNSLEIIGAKLTEGSLDQFKRRRQELISQAALEDARIRQSFVYRDEQGVIHQRTEEQTREMNKLIAQHRELTNVQLHELAQAEQLASAAYKRATATAVAAAGGTVADRFEAKMAEINAEADADLKAGQDAVQVEAQKQAKIRALRRETLRAASDDAKTLTTVLIDSGSKQVRAVGHAAETIRRVVIGAQAAHAAVESAIEAGKAIGSLAAFDFRGAALHGAAALELAKAAALGAQESLGGGSPGGGGGSGAGGSNAGAPSSFEPRAGTGDSFGVVQINLYSQSALGTQQIQQIQYELHRAGILKRPVTNTPINLQLPTTSSGLTHVSPPGQPHL